MCTLKHKGIESWQSQPITKTNIQNYPHVVVLEWYGGKEKEPKVVQLDIGVCKKTKAENRKIKQENQLTVLIFQKKLVRLTESEKILVFGSVRFRRFENSIKHQLIEPKLIFFPKYLYIKNKILVRKCTFLLFMNGNQNLISIKKI